MNIYLSNYHRVRMQRVDGFSARLPYRYLTDCTVSLHSIRWDAQQDSQWPLKMVEIFPDHMSQNTLQLRDLPTYFHTSYSQKCDASQLEAMCHIPLTVPQPPGYD